MSDTPSIPQGWAWIPLGEIVEAIEATDPKQNPDVEITYFDIGSINNEVGVVDSPKVLQGNDAPSRARQVVRPDDVLFSTVRPYLKAIAQVPPRIENGIASTGFCVLRGVSGVLSRYLYFWVRSDQFLHDLLPLQRGVSYPAVRDKDILGQVIPLAPTKEQTRIVEKLEELFSDLDAGVAELKAAQKKLAQYRQSLLKAAVEGALTAAWRTRRAEQSSPVESGAQLLTRILAERRRRWEEKQLAKFAAQGKTPPQDWQTKYSEPVQPDTSDLPELPEGWTWASVEQLSEIQGGIQKQPSRAPKSNKYPFLRVANVARGKLKLDEVHEIELFPGELERLALQIGDILIVEGNGSLSEIGRCALWDGSIENAVHQNHLIRARPLLVKAEFLETWLNSAGGIDRMTQLAATTSGLYTLSVSKIAKIPVPLPPLAEQVQAVAILGLALEEQERQATAVDFALKQSEAQRKNILKATFSGQLVAQDPNDEPASVLLARIRAEREERAQQPKPRKANVRPQAEHEPLFEVAEARHSSPQRGG